MTTPESPAGGAAAGGIFFNRRWSRCVATCGHCPGSMHWPPWGEEDTSHCEVGRARDGTIDGAQDVVLGPEASYAVTFSPAGNFATYSWELVRTEEHDTRRALLGGSREPEMTLDFLNVLTFRPWPGETYQLRVKAERVDDVGYAVELAHAALDVTFGCAEVGEYCRSGGCCEGLRCHEPWDGTPVCE